MTMMWPRPRRTIDCATRRVRRKPESTLVRNIASVSSSERSRNGAYFITPALLRKISASRATPASSAAKPASFKSPTTLRILRDSNSALRRPVAMTVAPARANASAHARPMPALAPVTRTCFPDKSDDIARLYRLAVPFQHPVSQDVAADLAGAGERQLAEVLEALGKLVVRDLTLEELDHLLERELGARLGHHAKTVPLPEPRIGQPDHRGVQDLRMGIQDLLDLARKEFLAAAVDDLLAAPGDLDVALLVDVAAEIPRAEPSVLGESPGVGLRVGVVAEVHRWPACRDLADLPARHVIARVVDDSKLHLAHHPAGRAVHRLRVVLEAGVGMEAGLEHPVELDEVAVHVCLIGADGVDRRRGAAGDHDAKRRQVSLLE